MSNKNHKMNQESNRNNNQDEEGAVGYSYPQIPAEERSVSPSQEFFRDRDDEIGSAAISMFESSSGSPVAQFFGVQPCEDSLEYEEIFADWPESEEYGDYDYYSDDDLDEQEALIASFQSLKMDQEKREKKESGGDDDEEYCLDNTVSNSKVTNVIRRHSSTRSLGKERMERESRPRKRNISVRDDSSYDDERCGRHYTPIRRRSYTVIPARTNESESDFGSGLIKRRSATKQENKFQEQKEELLDLGPGVIRRQPIVKKERKHKKRHSEETCDLITVHREIKQHESEDEIECNKEFAGFGIKIVKRTSVVKIEEIKIDEDHGLPVLIGRPLPPEEPIEIGDVPTPVFSNNFSQLKTYPVDLWFLLSEYVFPEDIGNFARICKASNEVLKSPVFWRRIFNKYLANKPRSSQLPEDLQKPPPLIEGIRAYVIRLLHFVYRPFYLKSCRFNPDTLIGYSCIQMWTNHHEGTFTAHYLKLKLSQQSSTYADEEIASLVYHNPTEGIAILKINCECNVFLPSLLGRTLTRTFVQFAKETPGSVLTLWFSHIKTEGNERTLRRKRELRVEFKNVVGIQIFNWWDPNFSLPGSAINIELS